MSEEATPKPQRKLNVRRAICTCMTSDGVRRIQEDPECPVTFHNDQVDNVFLELGLINSDLLDEDHKREPSQWENGNA